MKLTKSKLKEMIKGDSCNTINLAFPNHSGTHIDFPYHFNSDGKTLNDYPATYWQFDLVELIDLSGKVDDGQIIGPELFTDSENLETEGGYAKEASENFKKKQEKLLSETLEKIDIVICTALIPGKKAPLIIQEDMLSKMQAGSVIYDLAAVQGGNTAFTEVDKIVDKNGVKIMGESNILNKLPTSASNLYAKNVFNFVSNLYDKELKKININLEDEIIEKTLIK